ncbi:MAG: HD domain-containing protein [Alphaproteobacteria bacterium]|nr:HD domain-containing protein [Alphaproteobacteria bacterium]
MRPASVEDALALLTELGAVPHLVKHHRLVAEAAAELCDGLAAAGLDRFDRAEVLVGAALHDAGKTLHPDGMHGGGSEHERAGYRLLLAHGVSERVARHAWMHAAWDDGEELEPILVALADKLWKGKRVADLEERAVRLLAEASGRDFWDVWSVVDAVFDGVAVSGDERLARSMLHPS